MRVPTGQYRIDFFNQYGERLRGESLIGDSLMQSHQIANDMMPMLDGNLSSYTIMRCVFNSLDKDANL
jgi:hypothetical protein